MLVRRSCLGLFSGPWPKLIGYEPSRCCLFFIGKSLSSCSGTPKLNLSRRNIRHIDRFYTQHFNRRHRRDRTLFSGPLRLFNRFLHSKCNQTKARVHFSVAIAFIQFPFFFSRFRIITRSSRPI